MSCQGIRVWTQEIQQPYRVADSFPIGGKIFVEFILFFTMNPYKNLDLQICNYVKTWLNVCTNMPDLPTWSNHGKTPMKRNWQSQVKDPIYYLCLSSCVVTLWCTKQEVQIILSIRLLFCHWLQWMRIFHYFSSACIQIGNVTNDNLE